MVLRVIRVTQDPASGGALSSHRHNSEKFSTSTSKGTNLGKAEHVVSE